MAYTLWGIPALLVGFKGSLFLTPPVVRSPQSEIGVARNVPWQANELIRVTAEEAQIAGCTRLQNENLPMISTDEGVLVVGSNFLSAWRQVDDQSLSSLVLFVIQDGYSVGCMTFERYQDLTQNLEAKATQAFDDQAKKGYLNSSLAEAACAVLDGNIEGNREQAAIRMLAQLKDAYQRSLHGLAIRAQRTRVDLEQLANQYLANARK